MNYINKEAKEIATKLNIDHEINSIAKQPAFITIKDHQQNFNTNPSYRLTDPTKSETQSCLVLYSFCANLLHSLIMWLMVSALSPQFIYSRFDMIGSYDVVLCCVLGRFFLCQFPVFPSEMLHISR